MISLGSFLLRKLHETVIASRVGHHQRPMLTFKFCSILSLYLTLMRVLSKVITLLYCLHLISVTMVSLAYPTLSQQMGLSTTVVHSIKLVSHHHNTGGNHPISWPLRVC